MIKHLYVGDKIKSKENRNLIQRPAQPKDLASLTSYTSKVDNYLADQFGFRDVFIRTANRLRYHLFNETTSKQITMGNNGFIFLNSHSAKYPYSLINKVCDITPVPTNDQDKAIAAYNDFITHYNNLGYQTSIAIIPTKSRIYPENLLSPQADICQQNSRTWLDNRVSEVSSGLGVYYPIKQFRLWKNQFPVYLKSYFHWNGELPYQVADDMMKNYWHISPDFDVGASDTLVQSDLKRFLQGLNLMNPSKKYNYKEFGIKECRGRNCIENLNTVYKRVIGFRFIRENPTTHRQLLILADSFGAKITEHFIRGFDEVNMISISNLTLAEQKKFYETVLKDTKPTHFLLLFHDSGFIGHGNRLNKLLK